jgi:hypothetical protein
MDKFKSKIKKIRPRSKVVKIRVSRGDKKDPKISFCITCKDRVHHLKKTLPINIKRAHGFNAEFCVLNYNSGDDLDDWIKTEYFKEIKDGLIRYYRTDKPKYFHMSHAKNMVHKMAKGEILCSLDADTFVHPELCSIIVRSFREKNCFLRTNGGLVVVSRKHFIGIGGYDESFVGWGWEDCDFKLRCARFDLDPIILHKSYYNVIRHPRIHRSKNATMSFGKSHEYNLVMLNKNNKLGVIKANPDGFGEEKDIPRLDELMEDVGEKLRK